MSLQYSSASITHQVTYNVDGFIDKNNDLLFRDLSQLMFMCKHPLTKALFPDGNPSLLGMKRPATTGSQFKVNSAFITLIFSSMENFAYQIGDLPYKFISSSMLVLSKVVRVSFNFKPFLKTCPDSRNDRNSFTLHVACS